MAQMKCAKGGHALAVPYVYFDRISIVGVLDEEDKASIKRASNWQASEDNGDAKPDGRYLCLSCFLELVAVMDAFCAGE